EAALGADRLELLEAAGQELVRVDLVAGVPDEAVAAEVERQVQRDGQLDDAEVAGEVGRADAQDADQFVADLLRQQRQLGVGEAVEVRRRGDLRQDSGHVDGPYIPCALCRTAFPGRR